MRGFLDILERAVFRHRLFAIISFALITCFLLFKATQIQLDASFNKNIPLNHDYMKVYTKHEKQFGGANSILISVCDADGDIFNEEFFTQLKAVHDQLYFIPGVNRPLVNSIFAPSARFVEVVEDGFAGGPIIPANFTADKRGLAVVKENIEKAKVVGRMIASDYSCAMVTAQLLETDPQTQEKLDTLAFAEKLETQVREPLSTDKVSIHIIGFAKMAGDVAEGAILCYCHCFHICDGLAVLPLFKTDNFTDCLFNHCRCLAVRLAFKLRLRFRSYVNFSAVFSVCDWCKPWRANDQ